MFIFILIFDLWMIMQCSPEKDHAKRHKKHLHFHIQATCVDQSSYLILGFLFRANKVAIRVPPLYRCEYKWSHLGCFPGEATKNSNALLSICCKWNVCPVTDNPLQSLNSTAAPYAGCFAAKSLQNPLLLLIYWNVLTSQIALYYISLNFSSCTVV